MTHFCLEGLSISYGADRVVHELSCAFPQGSLVALMGPNGGGKTTLLKTLSGLHEDYTGQWRWRRQEVGTEGSVCHTLPSSVAYLPQRSESSRQFPLTVQQVVAMGRWRPKPFLHTLNSSDKVLVEEALQTVGLSVQGSTPISQLSGGQFQRMLFGRMLVQDADLLLLDEPFSGMDESTVDHLVRVIVGWHTSGKTLLIAQHDLMRVIEHFPHALLLARHVQYHGTSKEVLTASNWETAHRAMHLPNHQKQKGA